MHNEEKTFRFSMRKPFEYKNFLEEKYTVNHEYWLIFLTAVSGGRVYRLVVFDLLRQISGN